MKNKKMFCVQQFMQHKIWALIYNAVEVCMLIQPFLCPHELRSLCIGSHKSFICCQVHFNFTLEELTDFHSTRRSICSSSFLIQATTSSAQQTFHNVVLYTHQYLVEHKLQTIWSPESLPLTPYNIITLLSVNPTSYLLNHTTNYHQGSTFDNYRYLLSFQPMIIHFKSKKLNHKTFHCHST